MITGVHAIVYGPDAEAMRAFFRDVLELPFVDSGGGWLIFALPPAELAAHPTEGAPEHQLFLTCDDVDATIAELRAKGVEIVGPVREAEWGRLASVRVPGGGELGIYQPRHRQPARPPA